MLAKSSQLQCKFGDSVASGFSKRSDFELPGPGSNLGDSQLIWVNERWANCSTHRRF